MTKRGELPVEEILAKVGLTVTMGGKAVTVSADTNATADEEKLREGWFWGKKSRPAKLLGS